jgi:hypothetical protein
MSELDLNHVPFHRGDHYKEFGNKMFIEPERSQMIILIP